MAVKRVLIQAGHVAPREPGFEAGTGTVREQEYTRAMRSRVCALLDKDPNYRAIPQPGDLTDVPCEAAIFLHGDGSANPNASGYCFGYPKGTVNSRLAKLIGAEIEKIPGHPPHGKDNYTGGLAGYYGYSRITTSGPEVLHEVGFLTNPAEQKWIFSNLDRIATAIYNGVCAYFGTIPRGAVKPAHLGYTVEWVDEDGVTRSKKTWTPMRFVDRLWNDGVRRRILVRKNLPIPEAK